jgi:hypothetical protein
MSPHKHQVLFQVMPADDFASKARSYKKSQRRMALA